MACITKSVSIIVTAYNVEKYIYECLNSIINQGDCIREIIVVNDGSTDYTSAICDECVPGREALRWVERPCFWACSVVWNRIYKCEIFAGLSFPVGKIHEDEYIFHETFLRSKLIVSIKDSLYCYRLRKNSVMASNLAKKQIDGFDAIYNRYNCYNRLGYTELYRGTIERAKGMMWLIYKGKHFSIEDQVHIRQMARNFKEMVHKTGKEAGLLNHIIALSPRMYYRVRGIIKGR